MGYASVNSIAWEADVDSEFKASTIHSESRLAWATDKKKAFVSKTKGLRCSLLSSRVLVRCIHTEFDSQHHKESIRGNRKPQMLSKNDKYA